VVVQKVLAKDNNLIAALASAQPQGIRVAGANPRPCSGDNLKAVKLPPDQVVHIAHRHFLPRITMSPTE